MVKLSSGQLERASEVSGNIAVAWFTAGVISPIFARPQNFIDFLLTFGISLVLAGLFFSISLDLAKEIK